MRKKHRVQFLALITVLLFISLSHYSYAFSSFDALLPTIERDIFNKLETEPRVRVFITLKTDNTTKKLFSKKVERADVVNFNNKLSTRISTLQSDVLATISDSDFQVRHQYRLTPVLSGYISREGLDKIKNNINIESVSVVRNIQASLTDSVSLISANKIHDLGYTGSGVTICVIDSGVNYTHSSLGGCAQTSDINDGSCAKVIGGYNYCLDEGCTLEYSDPMDNNGHGTHVAGIVASSDGTYKGVAPDAKLVAMKVLNSTGGGFADDMADAIEWCTENASNLNISVITMSVNLVGNSVYDDVCNDPSDSLEDNINIAYNQGIFVAVSSGNENSLNGLARPACASGAVSVGAVYDSFSAVRRWESCNDYWVGEDDISCFTNRGSNLDILAPGCDIISTKLGGGFENMCGTSQATPHVAGSAALLQEAYNYALTPDEILTAMNSSLDIIHDPESSDNTYFPRLNVKTALQYVPLLGILGIDWPTYRHDIRRTGYSRLIGDMKKESRVKKNNLVLHGDSTKDIVSRASIADVDNNGAMEVVVTTARDNTDGHVYAIEASKKWSTWATKKLKTQERWSIDIGENIKVTPTIANIDSDNEKEIIFGLDLGKLKAINVASSGDSASLKWTYNFAAKEGVTGDMGNTAVADVDNDSINEIIVMDSTGVPGWSGDVYVLRDNGGSATLEAKYNISNGGGWGAVSIADVDGDGMLEIIAPSYYGVYVFDYDGSTLTKKCNTNDGRLYNSVAVFDVDKDNKYELIYTTTTNGCGGGKTCYDKIYVVDSETCNNKAGWPKTIGYYSRTAPAIANMDSDENMEIVISARHSTLVSDYSSSILCYDSSTGSLDCDYSDGGNLEAYEISPNVFDVDGDGDNNIIISDKNYEVHVLNDDGTQKYSITVDGIIGSAPVIGDLDGDGKAELALKRGGSPYNILTIMSDLNQEPDLNEVYNITAIAGELIDINESGLLSVTDDINDTLTFDYSSPFNSSGLWQTTINDTGDYSIKVEVSDGNLSDHQYVEVKIFDSTTNLTNTFADTTTEQSFTYSGSENKTVNIRLPKNHNIVYSKIRVYTK